MQLVSFLEDGSNITGYIPSAYASAGSDYSKRSPLVRGDSIGVLIASGSLQPVQEKLSGSFTGMDLTKTLMSSGYIMVFSKDDTTASVVTSGTGAYTGSLFTFAYNKRDELLKDRTLASLDQSLAGYWPLDSIVMSGSDQTVQDYSSKNNYGTLSGAEFSIVS